MKQRQHVMTAVVVVFGLSNSALRGVGEMACPCDVQVLTSGPRLSPFLLVHSPSHLIHFYHVLRYPLMSLKLILTDNTPKL